MIEVTLDFGTSGGVHEVFASSLAALLAQVEILANKVGTGMQASVYVADGGRKPNGFDARTRNLRYNVQSMTQAEADNEPKDAPHGVHYIG